MDDIPMPSITSVELTHVEVGAREVLSRAMLHGAAGNLRASMIDDSAHHLAVQLKTYILAIEKEHIVINKRWPRDWWQAIRERWCPAWWLRRHPVQYEEINVNEPRYAAVCPHVNIETSHETHINWMVLLKKVEGE